MRRLRNLSLFTGSGIGDWAAEQAGIETVAQCENDPCCLYCLTKLWPETVKFDDIRSLSTGAIRGLGPIDIISGGFPCQDLSTAGRGAGIEGSRSGLWREMFRVIRTARPAWCIIENVPAIRVRGVDRVIAPLERIGYTCWPLVVGAEAIGGNIPRKRVWIVASTVGTGLERSGRKRVYKKARISTPVVDALRVARTPGPEYVTEIPVYPDGLSDGVCKAARNSLLRILGNGWVPQIPFLIYRWIIEQERGRNGG